MKIAAIDMGTNSFLCLVANIIEKDGLPFLEVIEDQARIVRLGEKVHQNGKFLAEALARAEICLTEFRQIINTHNVDKVIATATSAARDAKNGGELKAICDKLDIPMHIIEGSREAELSFAGAVSGIPGAEKMKILVVDVGGGSTEFIYRDPKQDIFKTESYNLGCVRLTEMFLKKDPIDEQELTALREYSQKMIMEFGAIKPEAIIAVAGTPTTLACVDQKINYDVEKVEGYELTKIKIKDLCDILGSLPLSFRKKIKGLDPMRADVIVAGCVLLDVALDLAEAQAMCVSTRGLRFGVALRYKDF